jgi:hypothetical protein
MNTYIGHQHQHGITSVVYWIHAENHNNISTQGYVGITNQPVRKRWNSHQSASRISSEVPNCKVLNNALRKYDSLIFKVVLVADTREYCERIEALLRPKQGIGWNIARGGMQVDNMMGGIAIRNQWIQYWIDNPIKAANRWWEAEQKLLKKQAIRLRKANALKPFTKERKFSPHNKSGYTGVCWFPKYGKWRAQIGMTPIVIGLGYFESQKQAHEKFLKADAIRLMWRQGNVERDCAITQIKSLQSRRLS